MYKRYYGNSGRVDRIPDRPPPPPPEPPFGPPPGERPPFGPPPERPTPGGGFLGSLLGRVGALEREDLLMLLILWLLYRESGDEELLMIMGAMFLL